VSEGEANISDMAAVEASGESHTDAIVQLPDVSALLAQLAAAQAEIQRVEGVAAAETKRANDNEAEIKRVEGVAAAETKRANDNEETKEQLDKRLRGSFWLRQWDQLLRCVLCQNKST
jgi:hypothetical protein